MQAHQILVAGFALLTTIGCDSSKQSSGSPSAKPTTSSTSSASAGAACPRSYNELSAAQRAGEVTCTCAADAVRGSVWGAGVYTTDSSICAAARHAGVLANHAGGEVTVKPAPGCPSYASNTANGITTRDWGSFGASFYFPSKGDGKCVDAAPVAAAPCPAAWNAMADANTATRVTCRCDEVPAGAAVYGAGIYTSDSSICRAAVHAGAIPSSGGTVTVARAGGCPKYEASTANGVTTFGWGSYGTSFYFEGHGSGGC